MFYDDASVIKNKLQSMECELRTAQKFERDGYITFISNTDIQGADVIAIKDTTLCLIEVKTRKWIKGKYVHIKSFIRNEQKKRYKKYYEHAIKCTNLNVKVLLVVWLIYDNTWSYNVIDITDDILKIDTKSNNINDEKTNKNDEEIINLIKEDKFLDTKEIRRGLTILFTALYVSAILGYVKCEDIKALSAVYGVIIAFYFGSRAIESSKIKR